MEGIETDMAENQPNNNRVVMMLAAAVVVLFIAFIAVVVLNTGAKNNSASTGTPAASTAAAASAASTETNLPGIASSANFDPATATKVPSGKAPKDYVAGYYQAILDKKWADAFKMQPAASQSGTVSDFQQTQTMYGMTSFQVKGGSVGSTDATVVVQQDLGSNGLWNATWTFVKTNGTWLVKERKVGMGAVQ